MPDTTIEDAILENATGPAKATGDSSSIEQHSLADQIAAAKFLASQSASKAGKIGIRFASSVMPGSCGDTNSA